MNVRTFVIDIKVPKALFILSIFSLFSRLGNFCCFLSAQWFFLLSPTFSFEPIQCLSFGVLEFYSLHLDILYKMSSLWLFFHVFKCVLNYLVKHFYDGCSKPSFRQKNFIIKTKVGASTHLLQKALLKSFMKKIKPLSDKSSLSVISILVSINYLLFNLRSSPFLAWWVSGWELLITTRHCWDFWFPQDLHYDLPVWEK